MCSTVIYLGDKIISIDDKIYKGDEINSYTGWIPDKNWKETLKEEELKYIFNLR